METQMNREFNVIIERDSEGYFVASVPSLPGCHTQATSLDELMKRIQEAIELCLEVEQETADSLEFVGVQRQGERAKRRSLRLKKSTMPLPR